MCQVNATRRRQERQRRSPGEPFATRGHGGGDATDLQLDVLKAGPHGATALHAATCGPSHTHRSLHGKRSHLAGLRGLWRSPAACQRGPTPGRGATAISTLNVTKLDAQPPASLRQVTKALVHRAPRELNATLTVTTSGRGPSSRRRPRRDSANSHCKPLSQALIVELNVMMFLDTETPGISPKRLRARLHCCPKAKALIIVVKDTTSGGSSRCCICFSNANAMTHSKPLAHAAIATL